MNRYIFISLCMISSINFTLHGADLNQRKADGSTILHFYALNNDARSSKKLCKFGANPAIRDNDGNTPLHAAMFAGATKTGNFLMHHSPEVLQQRNKNGKRPLDCLDATKVDYRFYMSVYLMTYGKKSNYRKSV